MENYSDHSRYPKLTNVQQSPSPPQTPTPPPAEDSSDSSEEEKEDDEEEEEVVQYEMEVETELPILRRSARRRY